MLDPDDPSKVLLYYAGGDGPHSGGGEEHGRADWIALAHARTESMAGLTVVGNGGGEPPPPPAAATAHGGCALLLDTYLCSPSCII
jgi:hypothetical protein